MYIALGIILGGAAGFAYWKIFGCAFGICAISQNKYMSTFIGALIGLMFVTSQGCTKADQSSTETTVQSATTTTGIQNAKVNEEISPDVFAEKMKDATFVILDVRTPAEFNGGHLKSAININYNAPDFADQVNKLDKSKTYLVYCQRGARSAGAANIMANNGFNTIYSMKGGLNEWKGELVN